MTTRRTIDHQPMDDHDSPERAGHNGLPSARTSPSRSKRSTLDPANTSSAASAGERRIPSNADAADDTPATDRKRITDETADTRLDASGTTNETATDDSDAAEQQEESADRAGVDTRRRGWFWHWNNVVTQYAPLIGLKGVGLLNSYTVWTDRRDESPHRGFAFPSQQSEADFYGEDRAELITINKILVALDLIEIRKEMLTRVDERGRRWRVPHNLYRVKDRPDGVDLRARDVMNVAILATKDDAVFRYVRRVFSERFKPIDGDNVWHRILDELRTDPTWQELQERTRAIEARASARSRAGHQRRNGSNASKPSAQSSGDDAAPTASESLTSQRRDGDSLPTAQHPTPDLGDPRTSVATSNTGSDVLDPTDVERTNRGSGVDVAASNRAFDRNGASVVAGGSNGHQSVVAPSNTTYDQDSFTTTTTTTSRLRDEMTGGQPSIPSPAPSHSVAVAPRDAAGVAEREIDTTTERGIAGVHESAAGRLATGQRLDAMEGSTDERQPAGARTGSSPRERRLADPAAGGPMVDPSPLVVSTFEAANDRRVTPLERHLLAELERDADPAARAAGATGAEWVVAAMREAVSSGSAFVAPKRIREIIARWSANPRNAPSSAPSVATDDNDSPLSDDSATDVRLPGGASGTAIWNATLDDLARTLDRSAFDRLLAGSRITRYWRGTVEITVASHAAADKLSNEYRGLVERQINSRLRRPAAIRFVVSETSDERPDSDTAPPSDPAVAEDSSSPLLIDESQVEIGRQVWLSLQADLARVVSPADLDRLAGVVVLGQDPTGHILLGTPSPMARRLIDRRYRSDIERSLAALFGQPLPIRTLDSADWSISRAG